MGLAGQHAAAAATSRVAPGQRCGVARHEARLREDVAAINRWREVVRANRLAKLNTPRLFGRME